MNIEKSNYDYEQISEDIKFEKKSSEGNAGYAYHRHDACEIMLIYTGDIRFYVEQTCFTPKPGSLIILNPNEMHRVQSVRETTYERIVINVKKRYMDELSTPDYQLSDCFYRRPLGSGNLRELTPEQVREFEKLYEKLEESKLSGEGGTIRRNAYAALLLLWVARCFRKGQDTLVNTMPAYVVGVMQYISEHLSEPICLSELSRRFHVSPGYLSAQFKKHTGLTIRSYLLDRKINYAKMLLQQGANVTEACYAAGFGDYANFIRSFKKETGMSPGSFRKS